MPTKEEATNTIANQQQVSVSINSQLVNVELHLDVKLQNEEDANFDSKVGTHGRDAELPKRDVHGEFEVQRPNMEIRT